MDVPDVPDVIRAILKKVDNTKDLAKMRLVSMGWNGYVRQSLIEVEVVCLEQERNQVDWLKLQLGREPNKSLLKTVPPPAQTLKAA
jgi:hypothetical protein